MKQMILIFGVLSLVLVGGSDALAKKKKAACKYKSYKTYKSFLLDSRSAKKKLKAQSKTHSLLEIKTDPTWFDCAIKHGGTASIAFYKGAKKKDVYKAMKAGKGAVFEQANIEKGGNPISIRVPRAKLCDGEPKFIGYAIKGTGSMKVLTSKGGKKPGCF